MILNKGITNRMETANWIIGKTAERPSGPGALMDGEEFTFHTPTVYIFQGDKDIWIILIFGCFT